MVLAIMTEKKALVHESTSFAQVEGKAITCPPARQDPAERGRRRERGTEARCLQPQNFASRCCDALMTKVRATVTIHENVWKAVRVRAARTGMRDHEVVEAALRRELGFDLLERIWERRDMGEDEAEDLALDAQQSVRRDGGGEKRSRSERIRLGVIIALLTDVATIVEDPAQPATVRTEDPHDVYLVALAETDRAVIVSGDKHLLDMAGWLPVYSPPGFQRLVNAREKEQGRP